MIGRPVVDLNHPGRAGWAARRVPFRPRRLTSVPTRIGAEPKPAWRRVPRPLRRRVQELLGARVLRAVRVWGGYAPSPTFRVFLADGRRVVFKGTAATSNDHMRRALEAEERVYRELGAWLEPWAPALSASLRLADWHVLLLEDLGRSRIPPWTASAVRQAMSGYAAFHRHSLGQSLPDWLPRQRHAEFSLAWARLAAEPDGLEQLAGLAGAEASAALAWTRDALPRLRAVAERLADCPPPHALLHFDTRSDNLRLQAGGRLRLFDWPYACVGPPALDVAAFAQSITCEGGPRPEVALAPYTAEMPLAEDTLDAAVASMAGYFALQAWRPPIPGLPRVRAIQRCQLVSSLAWCARRLRLPDPDWLASVAT